MNTKVQTGIHITDIEAAINYLRLNLHKGDQGAVPVVSTQDSVTLSPAVNALAQVYAEMVYNKAVEIKDSDMPPQALDAWMQWYQTTPDAPCIAICSTAQGDGVCKGCGRTFDEVQHWTAMTPAQKRQVWRRITLDGTSWRFNRYKERAAENKVPPQK